MRNQLSSWLSDFWRFEIRMIKKGKKKIENIRMKKKMEINCIKSHHRIDNLQGNDFILIVYIVYMYYKLLDDYLAIKLFSLILIDNLFILFIFVTKIFIYIQLFNKMSVNIINVKMIEWK